MQLTTEQRMMMIQKGMSPLDPEQVRVFLEHGGRVKASPEDMKERLVSLIGEDAYYRKNLGSGNESERQYSQAYAGGDYTGQERSSSGIIDEQTAKQRLFEDMDSYASGKPMSKTIDSSQLMSLKEDRFEGSVLNQQSKKITKEEAKKMQDAGYGFTIKYLNAFIMNLKEPSYENRIVLYENLLKVLKNDEKLNKNEMKQKYYRNGCTIAEKEMHQKLKG